MKQTIFSRTGPGLSMAAATLLLALQAMPVVAQQPSPAAVPALGAPVTAPAPMAAAPATAAMPPPATMTAPGAPMAAPAGSPPGMQAAAPAQAAPPVQPAGPTAPAEDTNPFSSVKPIDNQAMKQALPILEQRMQSIEGKLSAIQQVQLALPPDALGGGARMPGAPGAPMDQQAIELETATFVACVNGEAMFRDSDQKPFFVNAKEANQNEAIRRIGGCKH